MHEKFLRLTLLSAAACCLSTGAGTRAEEAACQAGQLPAEQQNACHEAAENSGAGALPPLLEQFRGTAWTGAAELWTDPLGNEASKSDATLTVADGALLYTWSYRDESQRGSLAFKGGGVEWQDSWHQPQPVQCIDTGDERSVFSVEYSYPAGSGPDWHWRIALSQRPDNSLVLQMTNIAPWGEEGRAVRMVLRRAIGS